MCACEHLGSVLVPTSTDVRCGEKHRSCAAEKFLHRSLEERQEHMADGLQLCLAALRSLPQKCILRMSSSSQVQPHVLVRVSMAVKRHCDHSNTLIMETFNCDDLLTVQRFSLLSPWWEMVACRQTWCWGTSWESYILLATGSGLQHRAVS